MPTLIYCADGNRRYAEIAQRAGFLYGACSGKRRTVYYPPAFLDLDWRRPDFARHLEWAAQYRPRFAVAGDAETPAQLDAVLRQAEQLAVHAAQIIVVPKRSGLVESIPAGYVVGYSVPTTFGGTEAMAWEFLGRRLHLLGGSPTAQLRLAHVFGLGAIASVDGNSHLKASRWGTFWTAAGWVSRKRARLLCPQQPDFPDAAFERSCVNIAAAWQVVADAAL